MNLTAAHLKAIAPRAPDARLEAYAQAANAATAKFGIDTRLRLAAFLANAAYETDSLNALEEYAGNSMPYAPFWGRGFLHLTHRENYRLAGEYLGLDLLADPGLVSRNLSVAWDTAGWFWRYANGDLNRHADDGNFWETYKRVLGGDNGSYTARKVFYDRALEVLKESESVAEYPTVWVIKDANGWAVDAETGSFVRARERPNAAFAANPEGWIYPESPAKRVTGPPPKTSGSYVDRHPTNFIWRRDVADLVRSVEAQYSIFANTYHQHPPGWNRDTTSVDFWGPAGRGSPINSAVGNAIVKRILGDPNPPYVDWLIFEGWIWVAGAWKYFQDDGTGPHYDHVHATFR